MWISSNNTTVFSTSEQLSIPLRPPLTPSLPQNTATTHHWLCNTSFSSPSFKKCVCMRIFECLVLTCFQVQPLHKPPPPSPLFSLGAKLSTLSASVKSKFVPYRAGYFFSEHRAKKTKKTNKHILSSSWSTTLRRNVACALLNRLEHYIHPIKYLLCVRCGCWREATHWPRWTKELKISLFYLK